jgi:hypothetical protein
VLSLLVVSRGEKHFCEEKNFALNPVFQIVVKLWFVFVCVCFSPLCFSSEVLAGISSPPEFRKRKSADVNRKQFQGFSERERSRFVASQYLFGVFEDRRVEEASKAQRDRERDRERRSATSFVFWGLVKETKGRWRVGRRMWAFWRWMCIFLHLVSNKRS